MSLALSGIGVSRGVAIGKAHIIVRGAIEVQESAISEQPDRRGSRALPRSRRDAPGSNLKIHP